MYQTVEAVLENKKISFKNNDFNISKSPKRILVTFIDNEKVENNIEPILGSEEVLGTKDHKEFISILESA